MKETPYPVRGYTIVLCVLREIAVRNGPSYLRFTVKTGIFVIALIILFTPYAVAAPTVEIKPSEQRTSRSAFLEDHLDLVLKKNGETRDIHYFYSSYGKAEAKLVRDAKGAFYVLLRHGEGRGTNVRMEYMTVFKVLNKLNELIRFPLTGPAGAASQRWEYKYTLRRPKAGGLKFNLTLEITGNDARYHPEDKMRTIMVK